MIRRFLFLGAITGITFSSPISFVKTKSSSNSISLSPISFAYSYNIVGKLSLKQVLTLLAQERGFSLVISHDILPSDLDKKYLWDIRANSIQDVAKAIEKEANVWVILNNEDKSITVQKTRWITVEADLEGTTNFVLGTGGISSTTNNSNSTSNNGLESTTGFSYKIRNQDVSLFLGVLSSLNIPTYPFQAGFLKMKVTPSQYYAVKTIMEALKNHTEVILGKVEIIRVDLNNNFKNGINWSAFFKGFRIGRITQTQVSLNLSPFSPIETPVTVSFIDKNGSTDALIQFLKKYGNVKITNTWIFETKTGTITPFGSYKEEPYITYQVVTGDTTTQVVPIVQYKHAGFLGNIYIAKKKKGYSLELALSLSDIYGYLSVNYGNFTETIPKLQTNLMKITTRIPRLNTTLMLTGFKLKTLSTTEQKIPFLGDIPLIGNLFKSTDKTQETSEFIILITLKKINAGGNYYETTQ